MAFLHKALTEAARPKMDPLPLSRRALVSVAGRALRATRVSPSSPADAAAFWALDTALKRRTTPWKEGEEKRGMHVGRAKKKAGG